MSETPDESTLSGEDLHALRQILTNLPYGGLVMQAQPTDVDSLIVWLDGLKDVMEGVAAEHNAMEVQHDQAMYLLNSMRRFMGVLQQPVGTPLPVPGQHSSGG